MLHVKLRVVMGSVVLAIVACGFSVYGMRTDRSIARLHHLRQSTSMDLSGELDGQLQQELNLNRCWCMSCAVVTALGLQVSLYLIAWELVPEPSRRTATGDGSEP